MSRILIVVPARYASERFPGKPLATLCGAAGVEKPLIQWSWEAAMQAADLAEIVVATDDRRIAERVGEFGGTAVMTSTTARNGTERCAEALAATAFEPDLVINLQGDSPLVRRADIVALIDAWRETGAPVLTAYIACDAAGEAMILDEYRAGRVGGTTVVADASGGALYFSKRPIPFRRGTAPGLKLHIGLYAYTAAALRDYALWPPAPLEEAEGLEQLRFLENGTPVRLVEIEARQGFWEVNNPEDVSQVERALSVRE